LGQTLDWYNIRSTGRMRLFAIPPRPLPSRPHPPLGYRYIYYVWGHLLLPNIYVADDWAGSVISRVTVLVDLFW
jgi:hypothetical protein